MIFISSTCSKKKYMDLAVQELFRAGFKNIELSGGTVYKPGLKRKLINLKKDLKLCYSIHNYFPPPKKDFVLNIASDESDIQKKNISLIKNAIDFSISVNCKLLGIHAGYTAKFLPEKDGLYFKRDEKCLQMIDHKNILFQTLDKLLFEIKNSKIQLAVENMFPVTPKNSFSLLWHPDEIEEFLHFSMKSSKLGLLLDLGHLNVAAHNSGFNPYCFAKKLLNQFADKIFGIHLSDNDGSGDQHKVNGIDSWQIKLLAEHQTFIKKIPVTFEWQKQIVDIELFKTYKLLCNKLLR